jgi:hypothetical protein
MPFDTILHDEPAVVVEYDISGVVRLMPSPPAKVVGKNFSLQPARFVILVNPSIMSNVNGLSLPSVQQLQLHHP